VTSHGICYADNPNVMKRLDFAGILDCNICLTTLGRQGLPNDFFGLKYLLIHKFAIWALYCFH